MLREQVKNKRFSISLDILLCKLRVKYRIYHLYTDCKFHFVYIYVYLYIYCFTSTLRYSPISFDPFMNRTFTQDEASAHIMPLLQSVRLKLGFANKHVSPHVGVLKFPNLSLIITVKRQYSFNQDRMSLLSVAISIKTKAPFSLATNCSKVL